jgi:hypothetical protein
MTFSEPTFGLPRELLSWLIPSRFYIHTSLTFLILSRQWACNVSRVIYRHLNCRNCVPHQPAPVRDNLVPFWLLITPNGLVSDCRLSSSLAGAIQNILIKTYTRRCFASGRCFTMAENLKAAWQCNAHHPSPWICVLYCLDLRHMSNLGNACRNYAILVSYLRLKFEAGL